MILYFSNLSALDLQEAWRRVPYPDRQDPIAEEGVDGCGFSVRGAAEEDDLHVVSAEDFPYAVDLWEKFNISFKVPFGGILIDFTILACGAGLQVPTQHL